MSHISIHDLAKTDVRTQAAMKEINDTLHSAPLILTNSLTAPPRLCIGKYSTDCLKIRHVWLKEVQTILKVFYFHNRSRHITLSPFSLT